MLSWGELTDECQENLIEEVKASIIEDQKEEGEKFLKQDYIIRTPESWEEAYCREYALAWEYWNEWEEGEYRDKELEPSLSDWRYWVEEEAQEKAENELMRACKYLYVDLED